MEAVATFQEWAAQLVNLKSGVQLEETQSMDYARMLRDQYIRDAKTPEERQKLLRDGNLIVPTLEMSQIRAPWLQYCTQAEQEEMRTKGVTLASATAAHHIFLRLLDRDTTITSDELYLPQFVHNLYDRARFTDAEMLEAAFDYAAYMLEFYGKYHNLYSHRAPEIFDWAAPNSDWEGVGLLKTPCDYTEKLRENQYFSGYSPWSPAAHWATKESQFWTEALMDRHLRGNRRIGDFREPTADPYLQGVDKMSVRGLNMNMDRILAEPWSQIPYAVPTADKKGLDFFMSRDSAYVRKILPRLPKKIEQKLRQSYDDFTMHYEKFTRIWLNRKRVVLPTTGIYNPPDPTRTKNESQVVTQESDSNPGEVQQESYYASTYNPWLVPRIINQYEPKSPIPTQQEKLPAVDLQQDDVEPFSMDSFMSGVSDEELNADYEIHNQNPNILLPPYEDPLESVEDDYVWPESDEELVREVPAEEVKPPVVTQQIKMEPMIRQQATVSDTELAMKKTALLGSAIVLLLSVS
tara:strand:+ start:3770 stop:5332 length:1563 start_codon:yes stop_codon:yes gene_type:complete